ncbi:uncharacterized protein BO66DRAFT_392861 [Aspergillus aculeatinus CBS 121060]|uniref:Uncharacterized protein n=1 Tax=Aspergillus aculeatinus CBS 121060 TaxID=1448322 RepID=A0ACD1H5A2_9EURO|nr:hypothetical protein BO66DRAFT_392861 [Aspergillus aculeatinus CBS 121060]RAH68754.1 hypothetical protein BO66DRAFT_392861 [Aspergillus aculeatinus CBS 121060]
MSSTPPGPLSQHVHRELTNPTSAPSFSATPSRTLPILPSHLCSNTPPRRCASPSWTRANLPSFRKKTECYRNLRVIMLLRSDTI